MDPNKKEFAVWALLLAVVGSLFYYAIRSERAPSAPADVAPAPEAAAPAAPAETPLPKLEDSDELVRSEAGALSPHAAFAAWLKQEDLIARFAAAAHILARGQVPRDSLAALAPRKMFTILLAKKGVMIMDPRGYARYDAVADAVQSIDAARAAALYEKFKPLVHEAEAGLGEKDAPERNSVVRAIDELLRAPALEGDVLLRERKKGITYAFADDALERLSPAQKQLMRMGPKNTAKIQTKLREIRLALDANGVR